MGYVFKKVLILVLAAFALSLTACDKKSSGAKKYQPRGAKTTKKTNGYRGDDSNIPSVSRDSRTQVQSQTIQNSSNRTVGAQLPKNVGSQNKAILDDPDSGEVNGGIDLGRDDEEGLDVLADTTVDISEGDVEILGNSNQCGEAHKRNETEWFPGTLFPPAQLPILTGGKSPRGFDYSDSHDDSAMAEFANAFRKNIKDCMIKPSLELAQRISNVEVYTDIYKKAEARVTIGLYDGSLKGRGKSQKEKIIINFMGKFGGKMNSTRQFSQLIQTNKTTHGLKFRGTITCLDEDTGCQSTAITIEQLTKDGKVCRTAYIVHRHGNAHITIDPDDREYGRLHKNQSFAQFADYIGNTADANCQRTLEQVKYNVRRGMPQCAIERLKKTCQGLPLHTPFAKSIRLQTWSVLYGTAKFRLKIDNVLRLDGPLFIAPIRPIAESQAIRVKGTAGVSGAYLMNNDGAGQLNIGLMFAGSPKVEMRMTVSSLFKDSILGDEKVVISELTEQTTPEEQITGEGQEEFLPGEGYNPDGDMENNDDSSLDSEQNDAGATQNQE